MDPGVGSWPRRGWDEPQACWESQKSIGLNDGLTNQIHSLGVQNWETQRLSCSNRNQRGKRIWDRMILHGIEGIQVALRNHVLVGRRQSKLREAGSGQWTQRKQREAETLQESFAVIVLVPPRGLISLWLISLTSSISPVLSWPQTSFAWAKLSGPPFLATQGTRSGIGNFLHKEQIVNILGLPA